MDVTRRLTTVDILGGTWTPWGITETCKQNRHVGTTEHKLKLANIFGGTWRSQGGESADIFGVTWTWGVI